MEGIQTFRARDLDLDSGHTAYRRASLIDLYLHTKFNSNRSNFLWTDGRTDGRTYGHFSPYIIRSTFGSRPKNVTFGGPAMNEVTCQLDFPNCFLRFSTRAVHRPRRCRLVSYSSPQREHIGSSFFLLSSANTVTTSKATDRW